MLHLADQTKAQGVTFAQSIGEAGSNNLHKVSASAVSSQFAIDSLQSVLADLDLSPSFQEQLQAILATSQVSWSTLAESTELAGKIKSAAACGKRDLWPESSRFSPAIVK